MIASNPVRIEKLRASLGRKSFTAKSVLAGKEGIEVSIPNIIVAIVVSLVVIASVVAGIVFIVPFAQNASAQGDLQTVASAEQIFYAQSAPSVFGIAATVGTVKGLVETKALLASSKKIAFKVPADGSSYCAGTVSGAGVTYWVSSASSDVVSTNPDAANCPTVAEVAAAPKVSK